MIHITTVSNISVSVLHRMCIMFIKYLQMCPDQVQAGAVLTVMIWRWLFILGAEEVMLISNKSAAVIFAEENNTIPLCVNKRAF